MAASWQYARENVGRDGTRVVNPHEYLNTGSFISLLRREDMSAMPRIGIDRKALIMGPLGYGLRPTLP